jgi:hypothetical protein
MTPNAFASVFNMRADQSFGPLWNDPKYVLECLRKYLGQAGHVVPLGFTVNDLASYWADHVMQPDYEEITATLRLLQLGKGEAVIRKDVSS